MGLNDSKFAEAEKIWNELLVKKHLIVPHRCRLFQSLHHGTLFNSFLESSANIFILSYDQVFSLLQSHSDKDAVKDVISYFKHLKETEKSLPGIDILSLCSASLLSSKKLSADEKVRKLFEWMDLGGYQSVSLADFSLALVAYFTGIKLILGLPNPIDEEYILTLAALWFNNALSTTSIQSEHLERATITLDHFLAFAANRHYPLYIILEAFQNAETEEEVSHSLAEVVLADVATGADEPTQGDQVE